MGNYYNISGRKRSIFSYFSVTFLLILTNAITFIIFTALIYFNAIPIDFIAIKPANILQGNDLWTFITSMFMHAGFLHLFVNMLSLIFIGGLVEKILGRKRFFWFYIISGVFAGIFFILASLVLTSDIGTYAVGASGALFGLVGLLVILTPNLPVYLMFIPIPIKMKYAAPLILVLLWLISIAGNVPIGNMAHLGGLIAGLVYGIYLKNKYKRKTSYLNGYFS